MAEETPRGYHPADSNGDGVVTPEEVVDAYIESNRALFEINREMFKDIKAAQALGMTEDDVEEKMVKRGERRAFGFLNEGLFRPYAVSRDVAELFETRSAEISASASVALVTSVARSAAIAASVTAASTAVKCDI